ncbi:cupin domain-containing protein [Lyngbya sp. CCY1209]|uniref:cupin domain-containing protein n=1 Tax=Lyngbya sp. CCY1209 TaxID=2886103 RepID=UPI002D203CE2|nr:cupin domain-containing protein [Lyngbya sp. CCY1209]MEB3882795.1 cupin domain-containing protein [Lyngbya sp. CCY1209]
MTDWSTETCDRLKNAIKLTDRAKIDESPTHPEQSMKPIRYSFRRRFWLFAIALSIPCTLFAHQIDTTPATETPFLVDTEAGTVWRIFGLEIVGKVTGEQTDGKYAVVVTATPPEGGPPLHVHTYEDELFYIQSGIYEFHRGDEKVIAETGDLVHLPRGIPHRFRNIGTETGVTMNTMIPAGFERFFIEVDRLPKDRPPPRSQIEEIAGRYGLRFLPES